jgi:hypothetical protein
MSVIAHSGFVRHSLTPRRPAVLDEREITHGNFNLNALHAQSLKRSIQSSTGWMTATARQREALDMIASKLARIMSGQSGFADHWLDIAGYATLAADKPSEK